MKEKAEKYFIIGSIALMVIMTLIGKYSYESEEKKSNSSDEISQQVEMVQDSAISKEDVQVDEQETAKKELVRLVYSEGRNKSDNLNCAIAAVVINRLRNPNFPKSITDVIYQPSQFISVYTNTLVEYENIPDEDRKNVESAVDSAFIGTDPTDGALFFYVKDDKDSEENVRIMTQYDYTEIEGFIFLRDYPY